MSTNHEFLNTVPISSNKLEEPPDISVELFLLVLVQETCHDPEWPCPASSNELGAPYVGSEFVDRVDINELRPQGRRLGHHIAPLTTHM